MHTSDPHLQQVIGLRQSACFDALRKNTEHDASGQYTRLCGGTASSSSLCRNRLPSAWGTNLSKGSTGSGLSQQSSGRRISPRVPISTMFTTHSRQKLCEQGARNAVCGATLSLQIMHSTLERTVRDHLVLMAKMKTHLAGLAAASVISRTSFTLPL